MKRAFVFGSINMDMVMYTDRMPLLGESKLGHGMMSNLGGKGANQAIAAKRLGLEEVYLLGAVGNDFNSTQLRKEIESYGVNTSGVQKVEDATCGTCFIIFDEEQRDNVILVDKGANLCNDPAKIEGFLRKNARKGDLLITQLETNLEALYRLVEVGKELGLFIIFNPAPVCEFQKEILEQVDLVVVNETEAFLLTGIKVEKEDSLKQIHQKLSAKSTLVTLGAKGAYYMDDKEIVFEPSIKTNVVDTTCAGDTFIGALASKKAKGEEIKDSLKFAAVCSSLTISKKGAAGSIPSLNEAVHRLKEVSSS